VPSNVFAPLSVKIGRRTATNFGRPESKSARVTAGALHFRRKHQTADVLIAGFPENRNSK
jgi:hypothetical protein